MKICVTGGSGFIGKAVLKRHPDAVSVPRRFLYQPDNLKKFMTVACPDVVIHLAAYGNMNDQKDLYSCIRANYLATYNLLKSVREIPIRAFVFSSSSSVYGKKDMMMEEDDRIDPRSAYAVTKAAAEYLCLHYDMPVVIARLFSVYGPGEADFRFIPQVIHKIIHNEPISIINGNHDWIYIDDVVRAFDIMISKINKFKGQVVNVGTGVQTSNKNVVKMLGRISKKHLKITKSDIKREYDSPSWVADCYKLVTSGWNCEDLEDGLRKTYEYFSQKSS